MEIKQGLEKIPNLVINFDETMTAKDTVIKVLDYLIEELPEMKEEFNHRQKGFKEIVDEYRLAKKEKREPEVRPIKYFYENVLKGININNLNKVYDRIVDETELNPNLEKVFEYLKKELKIETIPLFALSLNNHELIRKFYNKNLDFFKKHNVEIIDIIGNQIKTNENNQIIGVYEHVMDQNKSEYIPDQSIMLADNRETRDLIEQGVNVVNVQEEKFHEGVLFTSLKLREFITIALEIEPRNEKEKNDIKKLINNLVLKAKEIKLEHEKDKPINILLSQYLTFYNESRKILLDLTKKEG